MSRVITQTLRQRAADTDGFVANGTFAAGPLTLDGALVTNNPFSGNAEIDFEGDGFLGILVGFTTGATGSVADATIVGRDIYGNPVTEVVTMPGAASAVSSTIPLLFIESITLDGAATNLSVGIIAADAQYGPWIAGNYFNEDINVTLDVRLNATTANYTLEHTIQEDLLRNGYDGSSKFDEGAPWAGATTDVQGQVVGPYIGSRIRLNSGTNAVLTVRWLQAGGGTT